MTSDYVSERMIGGLYTESVGEYTLPDFNPDVRKVLSVFPSLTRAECFTDDSGALYTGSVNYSIVYLDFENNISHCEFSTDYEYRAKCDMEKYIDSCAQTVITNYNVRLVGPRKFSAKCAICGTVRISERCDLTIEGDTLERGAPERLTASVKVGNMIRGVSEEREYAETVEHIEGIIADECEVIASVAAVKSDSVSVNSSSVIHRGSISVSCLVACTGEVPHKASVEIPFEERFFEGEDKREGGDAHAELDVLSLKCNVVPDENGVNIVASVITSGEMVISCNSELSIVKDVFSTRCGSENTYGNFGYREYIGCAEEKSELTDRILAEEAGCEGVRNVLFSDARGRVTETEIVGDLIKVRGEVRFNGIACQIDEAGEPIYTGVKLDVPFEQNVNMGCHLEMSDKITAIVRTSDSVIELDSLHLIPRCNITVSVEVYRDSTCDYLSSSYLTDEEYLSEDGVVTVYYPEPGETLFDIAKKYHRSLVSVASVNSITESVFKDTLSPIRSLGVDKLIIR